MGIGAFAEVGERDAAYGNDTWMYYLFGNEVVNAEVQATSLMMKNLCMSKTRKIHRDGERERLAQKTLCIMSQEQQ